MGKGLEQTLLQGRHTEGPETYEKMLGISNHLRDANEIPLYTSENGHHKQINKQVLERMWRKGNPSTLLELPLDPAIPLLGLYPKNPETPIQKNLCTPVFIAVQFTIAKYWKQPKCPSANEWIQKLWYIFTMEFYAAERKKELIPFSEAWMTLASIMLSEISQMVRDKYHMISPLTGT